MDHRVAEICRPSGALEYCVVAAELARGWVPVASLIARGNALIGSLKSLPDDKKDASLPRMAAGEYLGAFALSEPHVGSKAKSSWQVAFQFGPKRQ